MIPDRGPSDVQIYKKAGGYRVRPATHAAGRGSRVTFYNAGPAGVSLLFPELLFVEVSGCAVSIPADETVTLTVRDVPYGVYPYAAFYVDPSGEKDFATGESGPVIIIDR